MEVKGGCRKNQGPPPSPYWLYVGGEDGEKMAFFSITQIGDEKDVKTTPPELGGKIIKASCFGWLVLLDVDDDVDEQEEYYQYSLWNPLTLESICLPTLRLKPEQDLRDCILTSPPGNDDSILLFFEKKVTSLIFCRIGDEHWTHQPIIESDEIHNLSDFVVCNGTLYCRDRRSIVRIDMSVPDRHLSLVLFDASPPEFQESAIRYSEYRTESLGELFEIRVFMEGSSSNKVDAVEVFRFDFSSMEWKRVESLDDRAFFLVGWTSFSCQAIGSGIKGNHVYFTLNKDLSLYSFNMEDKTVSVSLPCSNLSISCKPILVVPDLRNDNIESKNNDLDIGRKVIKSENRQVVKRAPPTEAEAGAEAAIGDFGKLPSDMVFEIGRCLILGDYMSFRAVNKVCRLAAPPIQWRSARLKGFTDYNSLPPWLTSFKKGDAISNFLCPFSAERYFVSIPNNELKDVKMCYSRDGWCVMLQGQRSMFLWNPLVEGIFVLPDLLCDWDQVIGFSISSSIDCVVLIGDNFSIDYIFLEDSEWSSFNISGLCDFYFWVSIPTFYEGAFYFFFEDGNLAMFKLEEEPFFQILNQLKAPCSFHRIFLLQCDGMLLSVLVGFLGEWILVFELDFSKRVWVEVENLGKNTLFISRFSCFSRRAPSPKMENRIYFPRFCEKDGNIIYYSLSTGKLHSHGTEEVLKNFYNTKEQLHSTWIEPSWNWDVNN